MKKPQLSPIMQEYLSMKEQYSDALLFYRLGDFYEMFFDDAVTASDFLGLTLTGRDCGLEERAPMCGVPYHAVDTYIKKLLSGGYKVAICEQMNTPSETKGPLTREVVRVVSAGTVIEEGFLEDKTNNYLASVFIKDDSFGMAWTDFSTGEFKVFEYKGVSYISVLEDMLITISPSEIICNSDASKVEFSQVKQGRLPVFQKYVDWAFGFESANKRLLRQFSVSTLEAFECDDKKLAISAAGALIEYLLSTQKRSISHINAISLVKDNSYMVLDGNTRRNLELVSAQRDGKRKGSLLWLLDDCVTAMGSRNMRRWIEQPILDSVLLNKRLEAVEELFSNAFLRADLQENLRCVRDLERLSARLAFGNINPRDIVSIGETLKVLPKIQKSLVGVKSKYLKETKAGFYCNPQLCDLISNSIIDNPPALIRDGKFIKKGFNAQLDEYNLAQSEGKNWLAKLEAAERDETGIKTLKIGFNKIFGYYIEVSKSQTDSVPLRYQRKQTLVGGERYITQELKDIEEKILGAEENAIRLEQQLFSQIVQELLKHLQDFQATAQAIADIDTILSLASVAVKRNYHKPIINNKIRHIKIDRGRHPVVEAMLDGDSFVPNDTNLNGEDNRTMIITGPNMAGKSTYMRQVALITLMAHIGSYVPADSAEIALTDRIFTRIGASDDLAVGQSTFMVEMVEVATILNNATNNSLLILDEIGRGTSTTDGLSIAWAVMEYISSNLKAKTLFATHFHELTELEGLIDGAKNYQILIKEISNSIVFLHKIVRGGANKSFGIEVAHLAGVPNCVVDRAKNILQQLEEINIGKDTNSIMLSAKHSKTQQLSLFEEDKNQEIIQIIKDTDINNCSPMQAFAILMDIKDKLK